VSYGPNYDQRTISTAHAGGDLGRHHRRDEPPTDHRGTAGLRPALYLEHGFRTKQVAGVESRIRSVYLEIEALASVV
jgi:hypothetical protein